MKKEAKYRFEPIWLIILDLLFIYFIYIAVIGFISPSGFDIYLIWVLGLFAFALWPAITIVDLTFKMMKGVPALVITENGIIDNINNLSVKWSDILEIYITKEGRFAGNLVINLNHPEEFFGKTRLRFKIYKIRKYFTSADIAIKLSFVKGKNEDIVNTINTYWAQS